MNLLNPPTLPSAGLSPSLSKGELFVLSPLLKEMSERQRICSFVSGKYSLATVSLYQNGEILDGKNSQYSTPPPSAPPLNQGEDGWGFFICSNIFGTSVSYSSRVYCLLRMQYEELRSQIQPKRLEEFLQH